MNARMHIYDNKECFVNQKNYLIIGASGGIGKAMVKQLIEMSANNKSSGKIFATYHANQPNFTADNLYWLPMDVSDEKSIEQATADIKQQTTHIGWVINCVGYCIRRIINQKKHYDNWRRTSFCKICRLTP